MNRDHYGAPLIHIQFVSGRVKSRHGDHLPSVFDLSTIPSIRQLFPFAAGETSKYIQNQFDQKGL
jgi:hypothetical protein